MRWEEYEYLLIFINNYIMQKIKYASHNKENKKENNKARDIIRIKNK